jgi:hypothetical protein
MDYFYLVTLIVAGILLILGLTYVGIRLGQQYSKGIEDAVFPPVSKTCPDRWGSEKDEATEKVLCKIPLATDTNSGVSPDGTFDYKAIDKTHGFNVNRDVIDFNDEKWAKTGVSNTCALKKWANTYNIQWDGITNYNGC